MSSPPQSRPLRILAAVVIGLAIAFVFAPEILRAAGLYPLSWQPASQHANLIARVVDPSSPLNGYTIEVVADGEGHLYADLGSDGGLVVTFPDGGLVVYQGTNPWTVSDPTLEEAAGTAGSSTPGALSVQDHTGAGLALSSQLPSALGPQVAANSLSEVATVPTRYAITQASLDAGVALVASGSGVLASSFLYNGSDAGTLIGCFYNGLPTGSGTPLIAAGASAGNGASFPGISPNGISYDAGLYLQIPCSASTFVSVLTVP